MLSRIYRYLYILFIDLFLFLLGGSCEFGKNKCVNDCSGHGSCNSFSQCECQPGVQVSPVWLLTFSWLRIFGYRLFV